MKSKSLKERVLVTGAGGFIGHHLMKYLKLKGYWVRGVDIKKPEYEMTNADEFWILDLRIINNALKATKGIDHVYNLAANMGGIGFIDSARAALMRDNVLIDTNMLESAYQNGVKKFFYSSSAVVYPNNKKKSHLKKGFKEDDVYPAFPESEYGWEKLFTERMCADYYDDYGLETRVARFHNVYGPLGTYDGGREKSPAALCRKIAYAKDSDEIEVWGDGRQQRSYCYIDDCVEGVYRLMMSDVRTPLNIGSDHLVSINQLIDIIAVIARKKIGKRHDITKPQGARVRNSDNTQILKLLRWEPAITLEEGFEQTYFWIKKEIDKQKK